LTDQSKEGKTQDPVSPLQNEEDKDQHHFSDDREHGNNDYKIRTENKWYEKSQISTYEFNRGNHRSNHSNRHENPEKLCEVHDPED